MPEHQDRMRPRTYVEANDKKLWCIIQTERNPVPRVITTQELIMQFVRLG